MLLANHGGRFIGHHGWWWGLGGLVPLILLLALIGLVVWAVLRTSLGSGLFPATGAAAAVARHDGALEEVRLRYARGEMSREEFLQRSQDLGGVGPTPGESGPPATA